MDIRPLRADEIEVRVQTVKENGCSVLLYKDARCDMRILDEVFGPLGWQRTHEVINDNLFCNVSVWDEEKKQWITKQDVGVESYTEKEKGQASDSFKRACFNIGIGRELYTAPFIWINLSGKDVYTGKNGKPQIKVKFHVSNIAYNDKKEITELEIKDDKGKIRYTMGEKGVSKEKIDESKVKILENLLSKLENSEVYKKKILHFNKIDKLEDLNPTQYGKALQAIRKKLDK